jgi:hypothetical protein
MGAETIATIVLPVFAAGIAVGFAIGRQSVRAVTDRIIDAVREDAALRQRNAIAMKTRA